MFGLYTLSKLYRPYFEFSLKESNAGYLPKSFLLYKIKTNNTQLFGSHHGFKNSPHLITSNQKKTRVFRNKCLNLRLLQKTLLTGSQVLKMSLSCLQQAKLSEWKLASVRMPNFPRCQSSL